MPAVLGIPQADVKWPLGGWLKFREAPGIIEQRPDLYADHAAYDAPGGLFVIATIDTTPKFGPLLHVSISHHRRDPFWHEIKAARQAFFPNNIDVMMMLPAETDFVNLHPHTFHLVQTPERWGLR